MTSGKPSAFIDVHQAYVDYPAYRPWWYIRKNSLESFSALQNISFELPHGANVTVFGREGSGKTTLLRLLTGIIKPDKGTLHINGAPPLKTPGIAAAYVSPEESEKINETCHRVLSSFAATHKITDASSRISELSDLVDLTSFLHRPASSLSTGQRLRLNLAKAALSKSPVVLLDDVADALGTNVITHALATYLKGRTVLISTRFPSTAEELGLPLMLLHKGHLAQTGTLETIAHTLSTPRIIDVWIEGLRYDVLRSIRKQHGVIEARLMPTTQFSGQKLRIHLRSGRYLPSMYDNLSQAPLVRVEEIPPSLHEILTRLK